MGQVLEYQAAIGETNSVDIQLLPGAFLVTDMTAPIAAGPGCMAFGPTAVLCADVGVTLLNIILEDQDDRATINAPTNANLMGGDGNDMAVGGIGNDMLFGGAGNDILFGQTGDDTLGGGPDNDSLDGGPDNDVVAEQADVSFTLTDTSLDGLGRDVLTGIEQANLTGGGGDNAFTVSGWSGSGVLDGGLGVDRLIAAGNTDFVLSDKSLQRATTGLFGLVGFEEADLTGGDAPNVIDASAFPGATTLAGAAGDDVMLGGAGVDSMLGGPGADSLVAGADDDLLAGGAGDDMMLGGPGVDLADFSAAPARVNVNLRRGRARGDGKDTLAAIENVTGSAFNDKLIGDDAANVLVGGDGDDIIRGGGGGDLLGGAAGDDSLFGDAGADMLLGGEGDDLCCGGADADMLEGGDGADSLGGGTGIDALGGGLGFDLICAEPGDAFDFGGVGPDGGVLV